MLLDHIVLTFTLIPLMIGYLVLLQLLFNTSYPNSILINDKLSYTVLLLPFLIYFLKDSYRGKSVGKRVIGLQVVNLKTGLPASALQCFIRNLLIPIWPIEVIISIFSPSRRLGDVLANTKVILSEKEEIKTIISDIKHTKVTSTSIFIPIIGFMYCYLLASFFVSVMGFNIN